MSCTLTAIVSQKLLYLNNHGGFILIPEVFIPNSVMRNKITKGDISAIEQTFYGNNLRENGSCTFEDTLNVLLKENILSRADKDSLALGRRL